MQDIRKPYTRSRSNNDLQSRVEQFESARYIQNDSRSDHCDDDPVQIPAKRPRRDIREMDMYPRRRRDEDFYDEENYSDDKNSSEAAPYKGVDRRISDRRKKTSFSTIYFVLLTVMVVVGVVLYTYVFDSATITVVPKYKDVSDVSKVFVFSKDGIDPNGIPFTIATASLSKSKTLTPSESRKVEAKASGKIIVYNNYDSNPQKLIKNTRFESSKGKIYRINQSIEVPGKKGTTPGSIEVMVYADSNGADYNIDNTTFSIPGFKGGPRESAFYAKSKEAITGGSSGTMSLVSLSDLNAAKDSLTVELEKDIQTEVFKIKKDGYTPMYKAVEVTYEDNEEDVLKGVSAVYKITATGNLMLANTSKLAEAIAKTLGDYDNANVRLSYTDALNFTRKESDHVVGATTLSILVEGKPRIVWETNIEDIRKMVTGKKRDEFKPLMKTINSIESAEINFSPLWLTSFPSEPSKIIITESLPKR